MQVKFKKLGPEAKTPIRSHASDAGLDLFASDSGTWTTIDGVTYLEYKTDIAFEIPEGHVGLIFPRSSISHRTLILSNAVGVIDSGYRGEIKFRFKTQVEDQYKAIRNYNAGERIGQLIILPYPKVELVETSELSNSDRGEKGFGSTNA